MTLYRAGPAGLVTSGRLTSWTSALAHAGKYATAKFIGFGGQQIYRAEVEPVRLIDIRTTLDQLTEYLDLDDYAEPLHDVLRRLAALFLAHGYDWVALCEHPDPSFDEWLYLGEEPSRVTALDRE